MHHFPSTSQLDATTLVCAGLLQKHQIKYIEVYGGDSRKYEKAWSL